MLPKVSIVTPSYNQAPYLEQTICSVLNQDYPNIEYIIVDGGSSDGSIEIIKRYEDRLAWWVSESDDGQSHAINKGFGHASGEIYNWLNSDDLLMPSAVRIAVSCLAPRANIGLVYGDRLIIDDRGNVLRLRRFPSYWPRSLPYHLRIPQETAFIRRDLWLGAGGLDEGLYYCMDLDLFLRLSQITRFYHIPFVLGAYREHPSSKTALHNGPLKVATQQEVEGVYARHSGRTRSAVKRKFYRNVNSLRLAMETVVGLRRRRDLRMIARILRDSSADVCRREMGRGPVA